MRLEKSNGLWRDFVDGVTSLITDIPQSVYERTIVSAIEEQWAMFLRKVDDGKNKQSDIAREYDAFARSVYERYQADTIIENPYHHITLANDLLMNESFFEDASERAMQHYEAAIGIDPQFSAAAFVGKAWIILKTKKGTAEKTYKQLAIAEFEGAVRLVTDEMAYLQNMQAMLHEQGLSSDKAIVKQLSRKMSLLGYYLNGIATAINSIKKSQRLIGFSQHNVHEHSTVTHHELERDAQGKLSQPLTQNKTYSLQFNDLTVQYDSGTIDQAVRTIDAAFAGESKLDANYQYLSIRLEDVSLGDIQSFLSPHVIYKNLNKENALKRLNEKNSYLNFLFSNYVEIAIVENGNIKWRNRLLLAEAVKVVNNLQPNEHVNLTFENTNETVKSLTVEFAKLNSTELSVKLNQIISHTVDIELAGNKEDLLAVLSLRGIANVEFTEYENLISKTNVLNKNAAIEKLRAMGNKPVKIKLAGLNKETALQVSATAENLSMSATFNHINLASSLTGLAEGHGNVHFTQLKSKTAESFIARLREQHIDFAVRFDNLSSTGVNAIVKKADLRQEDMEISAIKPLSNLPVDPTSTELELAELSARGMEYIFELNEQHPIPWRSICAVSMIAAVQMAAGIMLVSTGYGSQIGLSVMAEATSDLLMACRAYRSRNFNWTDYCKQKSVSLALSVTSLGWQAFQRAEQTRNIYAAVGQEMTEQSTMILLGNRKELLKELNSLAFAQAGVSVAEAGVREGLNQLADNISHLCFEHVKPQIALSVRGNVNHCFVNSRLSKLIKKMKTLDNLRHTQAFQSKIDHTIRESFDPNNAFWQRQWESVGLPLCKSILSDQQFLSGPLSILNMGTRVGAILNSLNELVFVIERVHGQLFDTLSKIDQEMLSIAHLLQQDCFLNKEDAMAITQLLKDQHILDQDENMDVRKLPWANFGRFEAHKARVVSFFQELQQSMEVVDTAPISMTITDMITDYVIRAAETRLVSPLSSYASAEMANSISTKAQDFIIRSMMMREQKNNEEKINTLEQKPNLTNEEQNERNRLQRENKEYSKQLAQPEITVRDRIHDVSQKASTITAQYSLMIFGQKSKKANSEFKGNETRMQLQANEYAESVADNEPAKLYEMSILQAQATQNGINIKIVPDDPDYKLTQEDRDSQANVIIFVKAENSSDPSDLGHWELINENGRVDIESDNNDCGYAVFAKLTGKSIAQLRNETAQVIASDPENFHAAMEAQAWLAIEHPREANDVLFRGGKKKKKIPGWQPTPINHNEPVAEIYFLSEPLGTCSWLRVVDGRMRHVALVVNDPIHGLQRIELDRDGSFNLYKITKLHQIKQTNIFSEFSDNGVILHKIGEINNFSLQQTEKWAYDFTFKHPFYEGTGKNCRSFVDYVSLRLFKYNPAEFSQGIHPGKFYNCPVDEIEHRVKKDGWSNVNYDTPIVSRAPS